MNGARQNIDGAVRGCEALGGLRRRRYRAANVGEAGSPLDRGRHDLPDAGQWRRDCSHSPWPRDLSRSASLWCRDRSGQRHAPSAAFTTSSEESFPQQDSQYSTSMLRVIERGGQTEVEHILGFVLKAVRAQIPFHTLLLAYANVKAFEQLRAAGRLP